MIIRTTPELRPSPDVVRAMERLEAQLRRAADDLAETLSRLQPPEFGPAVPEEDRPAPGRCGLWMKVAKTYCYRLPLHRGSCRTRVTMEDEAVRRALGRRDE